MTMGKLRWTLAMPAAAAALVACSPGVDIPPSLDGTWTATEETEVMGSSLLTGIELTFGAGTVTMTADTIEGGTLIHRLQAGGSGAAESGSISFSYEAGQQSADQGDGTFNASELVDLTVVDLEDIAEDYPAGVTYELDGETMTLTFPAAPDLVFTRASR